MIVWSIEVVKRMPAICDILVSTDDQTIAEVARKAGALVPWLRPAELATDKASSEDVCLHAMNWYETQHGTIDGLLLLQPTSPFRSRDTVQRGIELFRTHDRHPVIAVSPAESHPLWCFQIEGERLRPFVDGGGAHLRSQDLPPAYVVNGALYLIAPDDLRRRRTLHGEGTVPLVLDDQRECLDIDTEWDWKMAEAALAMTGAHPS